MRDILDLDRFPLDRLDSEAGESLIARCQADLEAKGLFNLQNLVRAEAIARCVAEIRPVMDQHAFRHARWHNIYFKDLPELPDDHPGQMKCETINHTVCADQIPRSLVCQIYEWEPLRRFLAKVMDLPVLHLMEDPLARANVMSYRQGECLNWHYDRCDFTTTLLLQNGDAGGDFQYRKDLRSKDEPNYEGVARVIKGEDPETKTLRLAPGSLNVFKGLNTPHRTTPVVGEHDRMVAVFSYYDRPGVLFSTEERVAFYGREQPVG